MAAVRKRRIDVILCVKLDRLGRNFPHLAQMIFELTPTASRSSATWLAKMVNLVWSYVWPLAYIKRKGVNPLAEKSARITVSSLILRAKALFFADTVARIRDAVEIPDPIPFASVKAKSVAPPRYRSTFDIVALVESAKEELAQPSTPSCSKSSCSGRWRVLRRHEIDLLVARVPLRRGRDPHRDDGALPAEVSFERRRHPRRWRASRCLSRLPGAGEERFRLRHRKRRRPCRSEPRLLQLPVRKQVRRALQVASLPRRREQEAAAHAAQGVRKPQTTPATGCSPRAKRCAMRILRWLPRTTSRTASVRSWGSNTCSVQSLCFSAPSRFARGPDLPTGFRLFLLATGPLGGAFFCVNCRVSLQTQMWHKPLSSRLLAKADNCSRRDSLHWEGLRFDRREFRENSLHFVMR